MKYLNRSGTWPSGNPRFYYRPKGQKGVAMPDRPVNHPEFIAAYTAAHDGAPVKPIAPAKSGTLTAWVHAYLASDIYKAKAQLTRQRERSGAQDIAQRYGRAIGADVSAQNIRRDMARMTPHAANNRLKVWRAIFAYAFDMGWCPVNTALQVPRRKTPKSDGFTSWTRADFDTFRAHWPVGSQQRLAFELLFHTCASSVDVVRLGPGMVRDGWLTYTRQKSGTVAMCPWVTTAPDWFEAHPSLSDCIASDRASRKGRNTPTPTTFLSTAKGLPRSSKAFRQWFSSACTDAGLPHLSAHGIRKGRAAMFKENAATDDQRMAILGHETKAEADRYTKAADLARIISGTEKVQLSDPVQLERRKPL